MLTYQWYRDGARVHHESATHAQLRIDSVSYDDLGEYVCVITADLRGQRVSVSSDVGVVVDRDKIAAGAVA